MFPTREISIGPAFRVVLGILGIIALGTGLFLAVREIWFAFQGEWLRLLSALVLLFVTAGGVSLLSSAFRGRLSVRAYHRKSKK